MTAAPAGWVPPLPPELATRRCDEPGCGHWFNVNDRAACFAGRAVWCRTCCGPHEPPVDATPRRRFLDDLDLREARARILLALSVLQHDPSPSPAVERACRCLRGELAL